MCCLYLDVGSEPGVDPVRSHHVRQRAAAGEAGGHSMAHFRQREQLEAILLVHLLQFFIRLLFTLTKDTAHHVATFLCWPLREQRERIYILNSNKSTENPTESDLTPAETHTYSQPHSKVTPSVGEYILHF